MRPRGAVKSEWGGCTALATWGTLRASGSYLWSSGTNSYLSRWAFTIFGPPRIQIYIQGITFSPWILSWGFYRGHPFSSSWRLDILSKLCQVDPPPISKIWIMSKRIKRLKTEFMHSRDRAQEKLSSGACSQLSSWVSVPCCLPFLLTAPHTTPFPSGTFPSPKTSWNLLLPTRCTELLFVGRYTELVVPTLCSKPTC